MNIAPYTTSEKIYIRWLYETDFANFKDLDRSETIRTAYKVQEGALVPYSVTWDVPSFDPDSYGDHSVNEQIAFCRSHLERGGRMIGAFECDLLVGVGLLTPEIRPGTAQLAYLHVSADYRRAGVATRILNALLDWACHEGAQEIYVSSIPSESAVGFYIKAGFQPTMEPIHELVELNPEDIHLVKRL